MSASEAQRKHLSNSFFSASLADGDPEIAAPSSTSSAASATRSS